MSYQDGDKVNCEKCGKNVIIKLADKGTVALVPEAIREMALKCQDCGYIVCGSCIMSATSPAIPTCPSCNQQEQLAHAMSQKGLAQPKLFRQGAILLI